MPSAVSDHAARVEAVAQQVRARPPGAKLTIRKATPGHSIRDPRYKRGLHAVDVTGLNEILHIDEAAMTVTAEGQVTMGALCAATLAKGLLPAVVPEFRNFTIAGLINGEGIQSSSHRYGVFTHTLVDVELVTAGGTARIASRTADPELFAALAESLGTLGIVTAATVRLVRAKRYVRCRYQRFATLDAYLEAYAATLERPDFHEGVIFARDQFVLLTGEFVDDPGALTVRDPAEEGSPYYFQHVRDSTRRSDVIEEAIPTLAYLARPERGMWWMLECHVNWPMLTGTTWGRKRIDQATAAAYASRGFANGDLTTAERDRCLINQDMGVRLERLAAGIRWVQERLDVYPIWNCAVRLPDADARAYFGGSTHLVDIGIYGEPMNGTFRRVRDLRALQMMVDAASLWGTSYLSWQELVAAHPERYARYDRARAAVGADAAFLHIRDKVVWVEPETPDAGKIPLFRMRGAFGKWWFLNPLAYLLLGVAVLTLAIWPRPPR